MVYSIIEEHGGNIEILSPVDDEQQRGTRFNIELPRYLDSLSPDWLPPA